MRILILDDAKFNLVTLTKVIQLLGFRADATTCYREALEMLGSGNKYDLVLTDFCMPEINGVEFLKKAKEEVKIQKGLELPPFVMFTAFQDEKLEKEAEKTGFFEILKKPLHQDSVKAITQKVLAGEHLSQKKTECVLLVSAREDVLACVQGVVADTEYELVHYRTVEDAKQFYLKTNEIKGVFCLYSQDVVEFYQWCTEHVKMCDQGYLPMPSFSALFSNDEYSDKMAQIELIETCFTGGLKSVINTSANPQKIREVLGGSGESINKANKVLIVEVSSFGRRFMGNLLNTFGVDFVEATSVEEACIRYLINKDVALVLTDSQLPDGSAKLLLERLYQVPRVGNDGPVPHAQVMVLGTKSSNMQQQTEAKNEGFAGYMQKPLDKDKMKEIVEQYLTQKVPAEAF